jgi:branched-chain amino acid transport system permease protein
MDASEILSILTRSLSSAGIYIFIGLGYNAIYATSRVFNLAQGQLSVVAMFLGIFITTTLGYPLWFALLIGVAAVAALAVFEELVAVRPVLKQSGSHDHVNIAWAITTLAAGLVLESATEAVAGVDPYRLPSLVGNATVTVGVAVLRMPAITLFVLALLTGLTLHLFYTRTLTGKALLAISQDREGAGLRGINTRRLQTLSWALGGGIAGIAAFFIAPVTFVYPSVGAVYTFKGFVAIAIGGMGNNAGAVLGGIILALAETIGRDVFGAGYRDATAMAILLIVLMAWPRGITGRYVERVV